MHHSIDIAVKWFNRLQKSKETIPSNFDFNFFVAAVRIMLGHDHLIVRTRCLFLIYNTLHLFPVESKFEIMTLILDEFFFELFFSWSWNVRTITNMVLLYQFHFINIELVNYVKSPSVSPECIQLEILSQIGDEEQK